MRKNHTKILITVFVILLLSAVSKSNAVDISKTGAKLAVYLPRKIAVSNEIIRLGEVGILYGDESDVARAGEISLGRISIPGQQLVIEKHTILSRLASNGFSASKVQMRGAEQVTVSQHQQVLKGQKFVEYALAFLKKQMPTSDCVPEPVRVPKDMVISDCSGQVNLSGLLVNNNATSHRQVRIEVLLDGRKAGTRDVTFRLKYNCRRAMAKVDIPAGTVIRAEDVRIERKLSTLPERPGWTEPFGLVARRRIPVNSRIRPDMLVGKEAEVVVKRKKTVVIQFKRPGFLVTAIGQAMQDGRMGDYIKVRNVDSQRVIVAKVVSNGVVEPVLEGKNDE